MDERCCPDCGHTTFTQRCVEVREYSVQVLSEHGDTLDQDYGSLIDSEREHDSISCEDCGWNGDPIETINADAFEVEHA